MARRTLADDINKRSPFDAAEQEAYLNILRTEDILTSDFSRLFREHGLSEPLYNALRIVRGCGADGVPSQAIADDMVKRHPDVTRLVDRLVERGLVRRVRSETDRRVVRICVTPTGRRTLDRLDQEVLELHRRQLGHMPADRLRLLNDLLVEARAGCSR
ncbi:MAG: MarR family transcriptional regulator [Planctomycetota bacterium]